MISETMDYRWTLRPVENEALVAEMARALTNLPLPLARALVLRGVTSFDAARAFFRDGLEALHDPFLMRDMERAAERLAEAIRRREPVMVYGDYDVDGTTATAMMTLFLRASGVPASFFIPNRFRHGYGLHKAGLDEARARGASLVIALDCGITAHKEAAYAREIGLDLIIADHHTALETVPEAVAVLNPKRPDCAYPCDALSGAGVGFKLIQATLQLLGRPAEEAFEYLDLLAVSIASDIVPIVGENRVLMRAGLERLATAPRLGLAALAQQAGVDLEAVTTSRIVFTLGPRINAAGRLGDAGIAVELMLAEEPELARRLAGRLDEINQERRALDRHTLEEALAEAEAHVAQKDPFALVLHQPDWHPGVIGIVASRIVERFHRPAVLLAGEGKHVRGSARSIEGVSIYEALAQCAGLLSGFGGHHAAAGVSLKAEDVPAFREALSEAVGQRVEPEDLRPEIPLDAALDLAALDGLGGRFWRVLRQFSPFGPENPCPIFWGRDLRLVEEPRVVGAGGQHLRLRVAQRGGAGPSLPAIGFGLGERLPVARRSYRQGAPLEMAFCIEENTWNGRTSLQLRAKDVRLART